MGVGGSGDQTIQLSQKEKKESNIGSGGGVVILLFPLLLPAFVLLLFICALTFI